jgi:hypothetical protein
VSKKLQKYSEIFKVAEMMSAVVSKNVLLLGLGFIAPGL